MRKVETRIWSWSPYLHMYTFEVPSYSKLLDINLVNNQLLIIFEYDDNNSVYRSFGVYDLSGNLLKKITLEVSDNINSRNYTFYGSTGFQAVLYNEGDGTVDYIMFNYNQKTGKMIAE